MAGGRARRTGGAVGDDRVVHEGDSITIDADKRVLT